MRQESMRAAPVQASPNAVRATPASLGFQVVAIRKLQYYPEPWLRRTDPSFHCEI
jgi:hypothetical protein